MYLDWKLIALSVLALLAFSGSDATLTEQQQYGRNRHYYSTDQQMRVPHQQPQLHKTPDQSEDPNKKCIFEVPTVAVRGYPHAKTIRTGSSTHMSVIETCCAGYQAQKLTNGETICRPVCENCYNGECVRPEECECFDGFVKNDSGDCVFACPISCLNGQCYLDGTCKCHPGYKLDESKKFCRPICSEGCFGWMHNCTEPETCGCSTGYTLKEGGCTPTCTPDCGAGGVCIEPNICTCRVDFTLKNGVCQSNCYQKCDNGVCVSKNRCICNAGFKYHEKTMTCIPT